MPTERRNDWLQTTEKQADRQASSKRLRQTARQLGRETDRRASRQIGRHSARETDRRQGTGQGVAQFVERRTSTPMRQVRFPGTARDFLPRVDFQWRLSFDVCTPPCAIACINICAHDKDPVVHVGVRWIMATQTYPASTISDKNTQLDDCGRPSATSMLLQHGLVFMLFKLSSSLSSSARD